MALDFYDVLADHYNLLQEDANYDKWAEFIHEISEKYCEASGDGEDGRRILCDLGCGTGKTTVKLAEMGYDAIGVDRASKMLDMAREEAEQSNVSDRCLWLCQDITEYELFGTADVFVSLMDTVNHIIREEQIDKLFASFKNYMNIGGLFIFDIGTDKHFKETLGDNVFFLDYEEFTVLWANSFEDNMSLSEMTLFYTDDGKTYKRTDGKIRERLYSVDFLEKCAAKYDIKLVDVLGDLKMDKPSPDDERIFLVFKREK